MLSGKDGRSSQGGENRDGPKTPGLTTDFLWMYVTLAGSFLLRISLFDFKTWDYNDYLSKWYDFFLVHGRWTGLADINDKVANYPPLYLYLLSLSTLLPLPKLYAIKLISIGGDYLAAWYVWRLAKHSRPDGRGPWAAFTAFLFLPTVVMNGALWAQCDVMYTAGFLACLFYLLKGRPSAAMVAFGFSVALKPQAIFFCPFLAGLFFARRLPWRAVWIPAAVYAACGIPQMLAGRSAIRTLFHWAGVGNPPGLTLNAPNWYQWVFEKHPEVFWWPGIILTIVATAFLILWMAEGSGDRLGEPRRLVGLALLSVLFAAFLLPGMHERYFFAADVLSIVYAFYATGGYRVAILVQMASAFSYVPYFFDRQALPLVFLPFAILLALGILLTDLLAPIRIPSQKLGGL